MSDKSSVAARSPIVRSFHWLVSPRGIRRMTIILIWMVAVVALFYGFENWRGSSAWRKYRQTLTVPEEQLNLAGLVPPPVPEDQNFASTPFVQSWFMRPKRSPWRDDFAKLQGKVPDPIKGRSQRHREDLGAWEKAFDGDFGGKKRVTPVDLEGEARAQAAQKVLDYLKESEPILDELREASRRPFCRYPVRYNLEDPWGILLPHLAEIKWVCARLQLQASAELALGKTDDAMADTQFLFYMADTLKTEPFLIAYLVRASTLQMAVQPVWEGIVDHRWNADQLKALQSWFENTHCKVEVKKPLDTERAAALWTVDLMRKKFSVRLLPRGWAYQEQLTYCRLFDEQFQGTLLDASPWLQPSEIENRRLKVEEELSGKSAINDLLHHKLYAHMLLPGLGKIGLRTAQAQVSIDQAAIACALERYRLLHQTYPEKLEELSPALMTRVPMDVLSGKAMQYRRQSRSTYTLYSVGWNERDEAGTPGRLLQDEKNGDWVWEVR